jgi:hypothetical protein
VNLKERSVPLCLSDPVLAARAQDSGDGRNGVLGGGSECRSNLHRAEGRFSCLKF